MSMRPLLRVLPLSLLLLAACGADPVAPARTAGPGQAGFDGGTIGSGGLVGGGGATDDSAGSNGSPAAPSDSTGVIEGGTIGSGG